MRSTLYPVNKSLNDLQFDILENRVIAKTVATTEAQKEIWLACELGGKQANLSYNQSFTIQFQGDLHIFRLNKAIELLVSRHEALRSSFSENGQESHIYKELAVDIEKKDLSHLTIVAQEEHFAEFLRVDALCPFNLQKGPLFRFSLHTFNTEEYRLTFTLHHIVADGWSLNVILKDLSKIYSALVQNKEATFPLPPQISEYVIDEIEYKGSPEFRQTEKFWLNHFEAHPTSFILATDFPRKSERVYESSRVDMPMAQDLIDTIKQFGIKHQCSLPTVLISAFEIFLYQITFQKNIVLGLPTSGQISQEKYGLVGHCANLLPLFSEIDITEPFLRRLKARRTELFDAYDHQNFTFGELVKKIHIIRDHSRATLVPVVLNIDTAFGDQISFRGLDHKVTSNPKSHEVFEIFLNINHTKTDTQLEWTYNRSLFFEKTIRKYHDDFMKILEKIIGSPSLSIGEVIEKQHDHLTSKPIESTLTDLFYSAADQFEQHPAINFQGVSISYQTLNERSNQFSNYLIKKGIVAGDRVGISCFRSIDSLVALLGIIKARACYVPIDSSLPLERINYIVQNANIKLLFDKKWLGKHIEASQTYDSNNINLKANNDDLIYVLHTSGSTGMPKGVCMANDALVNLLLWQLEKSTMKPSSRTLQYSSLSFDVSFQEIFATLLSGGELILIDEDSRKDPIELLKYIDDHGINRLFVPFVALQSLADTATSNNLIPSSLHELITAGEQLKITEQVRNFFSRLQNCTLFNQYGPTECHVVSELKLEGNPENWPGIPSIGKEICNTRIYILDNSIQEVRPGEIGELCISGLPLAAGYLNQPENTSSKFITFVDQDGKHIRIYKTGDLAKRLPNGEIEFLGRLDFQVKIRGHRVELGEIEHHILAQKEIKDAIVTCFENVSGDQQLAAYIIKSDKGPQDESIRRALQQHLPEYMIPQYFMELNEFPKTSSGKIDRKKLPKPQQPNRVVKTAHDHQSFNSIQQKVSKVWAHYLNVENLTLDSNFFEMGGHSLTAINVLIELEKKTGIRPKLTSIFKYPRLKDFADLYTSSGGRAGYSSQIDQLHSETVNDDQNIIETPILDTQSEVWISSILGGDASNKSYNISSAHILSGDLDIKFLTKAIHVIVDRHESMRTTFNEDGSKMLTHKNIVFNIYRDDYSTLKQSEQERKLIHYSREISEAPFDLNKGSLFRFSLLKLSDESYYFIFTSHHLICDGYSIDTILKEISTIYNALTENQSPNLMKAPSLIEYAAQKNTFYKSTEHKAIKDYWLKQIPEVIPTLNLPVDFKRSVSRNYSGACIQVSFPDTLIEKIELFNKRQSSSLSLTMQILFELFLYQTSKQTEFIAGYLSSDQIHNNYEGLVGHCVNLLPIYCKIDDQMSFIEHFEQRKKKLIEVYSNQSITLGALIKEMNLKRDSHSSGPVSVVFNSIIGLENTLVLNGVKTTRFHFDSQKEKLDLTLNIYGHERSPLFEWNYNTNIFREQSIKTFVQNFEQLTANLLSDTSRKLACLSGKKKNITFMERVLSVFQQ